MTSNVVPVFYAFRAHTKLEKVDLIIKEKRLRWLGHLLRMDDDRLLRQTVYWDLNTAKRKPGRLRKNWNDTIRQDSNAIGTTWELRSTATSSQQERMASKCGAMRLRHMMYCHGIQDGHDV